MTEIVYSIRIKGHLASKWSDWFEGMSIQCQADGTTILSGPIRDQSALQGLLIRIRDLGLTLISVHPINMNQGESLRR
jgi:hypothetical protein